MTKCVMSFLCQVEVVYRHEKLFDWQLSRIQQTVMMLSCSLELRKHRDKLLTSHHNRKLPLNSQSRCFPNSKLPLNSQSPCLINFKLLFTSQSHLSSIDSLELRWGGGGIIGQNQGNKIRGRKLVGQNLGDKIR